MLTSSQIVARALGLEPDGVPAPQDGHCAFCGAMIRAGDLQVRFQVSPAFMDDLSLACRGSGMTCGSCVHVLSADGLRTTGYGVFHLGGVLPFRKWKDVATALSSPPEPPFVCLFATANNQHMAWRAPVNLSKDLFYVRLGLRDLKIRRPLLLEAVEASVRLGVAMKIPPTKSSLPHPFAVLSPDLKDPGHGTLRRFGGKSDDTTSTRVSFKEVAAEFPEEVRLISRLTVGETWALRFLLSPNAGAADTES